MLTLSHLSKTFSLGTPDARTVLKDVELHLDAGEFAVLLGPNGAGKSTLLDLIAGTQQADSGSILLDGVDITHEKEHRRARSIGRVFQDPTRGTAADLTLEENLLLALHKDRRSFP